MLPPPRVLELVKVSLLPEPVPAEVLALSSLPEPDPVELVEFSVLPEPVPEAVVRFSVLPPPLPTHMAGLAVLPEPAPEAAVEHAALPPPLPTQVAVAEPRHRWPPPVAPLPQQARLHPPTPARRTKPERAAPSGPRKLLVGFSAVVLGALSVVAIRALVRGNDDDGVETAVPTPSAVVQTSVAVPDVPVPDVEVSPTTVESGAAATTVATPAVSATAAPESATTAPTNTPTAPAVPVPTNTTPAPGATRFSGLGNDVLNLSGTDVLRKVMVVSHNGVADFELSTLDQDLNQLALIESAVGAVSGTYPLGLNDLEAPSYLRIDADGEWVIEIKPIEEARLWQTDVVAGVGSDVIRYEGGASVVDYTNAGGSNFIVQYLRNPGFDLLVNEIGPISGATTMQSGPGVVVVDAEGDWTLSARPT